jgi:NarL family two-component system sensor histidine kinase LiaS
LRHSQGSRISVSLASDNSTVTLEISDDGIGFDTAHAVRAGMGLHTMKRRAEDLGAVFETRTAPAQGTRIRIQVHAVAEQVESRAPHE